MGKGSPPPFFPFLKCGRPPPPLWTKLPPFFGLAEKKTGPLKKISFWAFWGDEVNFALNLNYSRRKKKNFSKKRSGLDKALRKSFPAKKFKFLATNGLFFLVFRKVGGGGNRRFLFNGFLGFVTNEEMGCYSLMPPEGKKAKSLEKFCFGYPLFCKPEARPAPPFWKGAETPLKLFFFFNNLGVRFLGRVFVNGFLKPVNVSPKNN